MTQLNALMHKKENKAKMLQSANNIISKLVSPAFLWQCIEDESFSVLEFQTTYPVLVLYPPVNGVEKFMGFACAGGWIYHCIKNEASPITPAELVQNGYLVPFLKEDRVQMKGFLGGWQFGKLEGHIQKACFMKNSENKNGNDVAAKSPKTSPKKAAQFDENVYYQVKEGIRQYTLVPNTEWIQKCVVAQENVKAAVVAAVAVAVGSPERGGGPPGPTPNADRHARGPSHHNDRDHRDSRRGGHGAPPPLCWVGQQLSSLKKGGFKKI